MKAKAVRKAPARRRRAVRRGALRWGPVGGIVYGPLYNAKGDAAGVMVVGTGRCYGVMGVAFADAEVRAERSFADLFDGHSHAIIAENVRSLAEAKRIGEAWARKFKKGLVLAPCACEEMVDASARPPEADHPLGCNCEGCLQWLRAPSATSTPIADAFGGLGHPLGRSIASVETGKTKIVWKETPSGEPEQTAVSGTP